MPASFLFSPNLLGSNFPLVMPVLVHILILTLVLPPFIPLSPFALATFVWVTLDHIGISRFLW